ncbi:MAG: DUF4190 domain-containing protein [Anaerolineae bacterium]|nr:DUF4190 domain-containing protein [Anaerolineae bacterium]
MGDYGYQTAPPNSGLAIVSLIASILGLTLLPTIGSIAGVIMGYMAKKQIEESRGAMGGEGMAKAGIIIGWIGIGLAVLGVCIALAIILASGGITACAFLEAGGGY